MNYLHGKRLNPLPHEMTRFEQALERLSQAANEYHTKKAKASLLSGETAEQKTARLEELNADLKHLQRELRFTEVIGEVETRLEEYRLTSRRGDGDTRADSKIKRQLMESEMYHPTEALEQFMRADGRPKPSSKHTAHHIAPGKGKTIFAARARARLHFHGVRINDADNGAWMLTYIKDKGHWSMPTANAHREIHTKNYEGWVYRIVNAGMDEQGVRSGLRRIADLLESGKQPVEVTMSPDESWSGV